MKDSTKASKALRAKKMRSNDIRSFVTAEIIDTGYALPVRTKALKRTQKAWDKWYAKNAYPEIPVKFEKVCFPRRRARVVHAEILQPVVYFDVIWRDKKRNVVKILKDLTGDTARFPVINGCKPTIYYH